MNRTKEIAMEILRQLAATPDPQDEAVLNRLLDARFVPVVDFTELRDALGLLSGERLVGRDLKFNGPRWFITGRGRAELHA